MPVIVARVAPAGNPGDVRLRRLGRSVESDVPVEGFSPYLVIKGLARVGEGGAVDVLREITHGQFPPPGDNYPGAS
jgi:hypothetical protein